MPTAVKAGDIVLVSFPYTDGKQSKVRPALVVQSNERHYRTTTVAMLTSKTFRARRGDRGMVLIDVSQPEGRQSGLCGSGVVCLYRLFTLETRDVIRKLGDLPAEMMQRIQESLKFSLGLS